MNYQLICAGCRKTPNQLPEYEVEDNLTPEAYVEQEEGTRNPRTGRFLCTPCYFDHGMPSAPGGWTVPDEVS